MSTLDNGIPEEDGELIDGVQQFDNNYLKAS